MLWTVRQILMQTASRPWRVMRGQGSSIPLPSRIISFLQLRLRPDSESITGSSAAAQTAAPPVAEVRNTSWLNAETLWNDSVSLKKEICCMRGSFCDKFGLLISCAGSRYSVFVCVHRVTHAHVPTGLCDSSTKPSAQEEPCNVQPCPALWVSFSSLCVFCKCILAPDSVLVI